MDQVSRNVQSLLQSIKKSEIYREYKAQEQRLMKNEALWERVCRFRANNFRMQNEAGENLLAVADQIYRESRDLRSIPEVNAYLDAELALCKLTQSVIQELTEGIDMHVPDL